MRREHAIDLTAPCSLRISGTAASRARNNARAGDRILDAIGAFSGNRKLQDVFLMREGVSTLKRAPIVQGEVVEGVQTK